MKALLTAIVGALADGQAEIEASNISIVPNIAYVPSAAKTPAACVKDGKVTRVRKAGGVVEITSIVLIAVWVQNIDQTDASVMGTTTEKGVLDLADTVRGVLENNLLGIDGMQDATCIADRESAMMGVSTTTLQRKIVEFQYIKETSCTC